MTRSVDGSAREYQDGNRYFLPKDAPEHTRLEAQSDSLIALMDNKPFHAPILHPKRILDFGCGTGTMTFRLAKMYPEAEVIGIDLAPVPESQRDKLPNIQFIQGDIADLIGTNDDFKPESFDYIFQRLLVLGMKDWPQHISRISSLLRPGSWMEFQETDIYLLSADGQPLGDSMEWYRKIREDSLALGLNLRIAKAMQGLFDAEPALQNVEDVSYRWPSQMESDTPEELRGMVSQLPGLFSIFSEKICSTRRGKDEVTSILEDIREHFDDGAEKDSYYTFHVVFGQKK